MSIRSRLQRQAVCPCHTGRRLVDCCLPWEEAFQRLLSRLLVFAETPALRRHEANGAAIFWNTQRPLQPGKDQSAVKSLRFLEWLLHDHPVRRGSGSLLAEFADAAVGLTPQEESLLLASLLAPVRAHEVMETLGPRSILVKDLLSGAERRVGPLGLADPPIRSDVVICRLLPLGRLTRPGASYLVLPAAGREEMLVYLRTAYRLARPARHVSLEDFLDGAAHLYHHFFLLRGRDLGGRAEETLRLVPFAPRRLTYRGADLARIRAVLDRQPNLERDAGAGEEARYAWVDPERAILRATFFLRSGEVEARADAPQDLADAAAFLETCLRGLIQPLGEHPGGAGAVDGGAASPPRSGPPGTAFLSRVLDRWPDTPSPLLDDRTPREACRSRGGREAVAAILLDLERDLARLTRLGRPSVNPTPVRERLHLTAGPPGAARASR
jgi:hypothetical protein